MDRFCKYCNAKHPLTAEFWNLHYGQFSRCKKKRQDYYKENKEEISKRDKQRRKDNPENVANIQRKTSQKNWARVMVHCSKKKDKKMNRYDSANYITKQFCEAQMQLQNSICHYCKNTMLYGVGINRKTNRNAATIERLDNDLGHTQDNCVLCCRHCQGVNHPGRKSKQA